MPDPFTLKGHIMWLICGHISAGMLPLHGDILTMPRPRNENALEALEAQREALDRKIKEVAAREKAKKAAEDHRRWLLAGQVAVQRMQDAPGSDFFNTMMGLLNEHARSAADRSLFGLGAKASNGSDRDDRGSGRLPGADIDTE